MGNAVAARKAAQPPVAALRILKDEKLAAMVAEGRDDAFAVLYRRHHQDVYRYCLSLLRQEADARDALQSSMLAALSSLRSRPIEGAFKPWLFRIAHNDSISIIRARSREAPAQAQPPVAAADDHEARERFRTLVADLEALPDRQRGAIVMRELSGLSYAQIAAALGTSEAGGKQLVYEARTALGDLRAGHEMSCEVVRERISADDRRLLRGRKVRSHLRECRPCQDFEQAIRRRRTALAAFAPPLAPLAAAAVLQDVFGGGGGAGGAGAVTGGGFASGGLPLAGSAGLKVAAAGLLAGAGIGAYAAGDAILGGDPASAPAAAQTQGVEAREAGGERGREAGAGSNGAARAAAERAGAGRVVPAGGPAAAATPGGPGIAGESPPAASGPPGATEGSSGAANPGAGSGAAGGGGGGGGVTEPPPAPSPTSPPSSGSPPEPPPGPGPDPPPPGGGGTPTVPPGTPPGHGGTPPGHGGTPPGQAGGGTPPGHLGNPGQGGGRP